VTSTIVLYLCTPRFVWIFQLCYLRFRGVISLEVFRTLRSRLQPGFFSALHPWLRLTFPSKKNDSRSNDSKRQHFVFANTWFYKTCCFRKAMHVSKLILSKRLIRGGGNEEIVQKTTIGRTKHSNICSRCSGASASSVTKQSWARSWAMHEYDCVQQLRQSTAGGKSLRKLFVDLIEIFLSKTLMVFIWIVCKTNVRLRSLKPAREKLSKTLQYCSTKNFNCIFAEQSCS